jgi:hypothetical protein
MNYTEYRSPSVENGDASPSGVVRDRLGHFAKDVAALAELQAELLQVELRDWLRKCLVPVVVLAAVATTLALASLPLVLLSLAYCLHEFAGLSLALSTLIAAVTGFGVAGICAFAAWRVTSRQRGAFTRFKIELARNIQWMKHVLTRPRSAADDEPW